MTRVLAGLCLCAGIFLVAAAFPLAPAAAQDYESADWMPIDGSDLAHSTYVRGGDGSPQNPFVVSGWERNLTMGSNGTELGSKDAYLVMRANHFFGDGQGPHTQCCRAISAFEVRNFTFEKNLVERVRMVYSVCCLYPDERVTQENLRFQDNRFLNITDGAFRIFTARNLTISGNWIDGTGGPVITLQKNTASARVFHNSFVNVVPPIDDGAAENSWDDGYPSGGNYWSVYNGSDLCKGAAQDDCSGPDGIGDTPYIIDADSRDRYPLMKPYVAPDLAPVPALTATPETPIVNETVTFDARGSADPEDGAVGLEFRWDLDGDGEWDLNWSTQSTPSASFSHAGTQNVSLQVRDAQGATANLSIAIVVADPSLPDVQPMSISAAPQSPTTTGAEIVLEVRVADGDGVASVQVVYRGVASASFTKVTMTRGPGNSFQAAIPAQSSAGQLEYYFLVTDSLGHQGRDPPQGTHVLTIFERPAQAGPDPWILMAVAVAAAAGAVFLLRRRRRG